MSKMLTRKRPNKTDMVSPLRVSFGTFHFFPSQQLLVNGETPVPLGSRAREILAALVEQAGTVVSKEALIARVWPDTFVEESNVKVHVANLRKALGDGAGANRFINNVPGRGYSFVAPVSILHWENVKPPADADWVHDAPSQPARIVGRADVVKSLIERLAEHRFITIAGPGGIGKTTVAMAVAKGAAPKLRDGVRFVDFSPLTDPQLVPSALASILGVPSLSAASSQTLISFLRDKQCLILLDNCEHLIEAVAALAEDIFRGAPSTLILATSREPLNVSGERIYRLPPLAAPPASDTLAASEALKFPAVQLFVDRASTGLEPFVLTDAEAPLVATICRTLDGIALAIEIAAARVETFGVLGLASRLGDRFRLLMRGRRTALTRHQTLTTTLDWSYNLLPDDERAALQGLAVFGGFFSIESSGAVLSRAGAATSDVVERVANLVAKSLVSASIEAGAARYRLLDTTRAYAILKLEESGELDRIARCHAEHFLSQLAQAAAAWEKQPAAEWTEAHRHLIADVRAALDWAFSSGGDTTIGVSLTVAAVPLWFQLSLVGECSRRVEAALAAPGESRDTRSEMVLNAALAWSLMQTRGSVGQTREAWDNALRDAEALNDFDYQLRALWGLWAGLLNGSEFRKALAVAQRFREVATERGLASDLPVGDRMIGYILHLLGDQAGARFHIERMLRHYVVPVTGARIIRFVFDQKVTARCFLARILWLQGFPDQAMGVVREIVGDTLLEEDMLSSCQALVQAACPVALFVGDLEGAERFVETLLGHSVRNGLEFWQAYGRCFKGVVLVRSGKRQEGLALLTTGLAELREIQFGVYYIVFLSAFAEACALVGSHAQALAAIEEAIERARRDEALWYFAELLRIKGTIVLLSGEKDSVERAQTHFFEALAVARQQKSLSWELRAATSLAGLWRTARRTREAGELLRPVFEAFGEGFGTADLRDARQLLTDCQSS